MHDSAYLLGRALLLQAFRDLAKTSTKDPSAKADAISFLTDSYGGWAEARQEVCDLVRKCPHRLRTTVLKALTVEGGLQKLIKECMNDKRAEAYRRSKNR